MNRPTRQTTAGGAYLGLRRIARETSRPTDELLLRYVLERFLYRVSYSRHADNLVLKGGMLLEVLGIRRPTRDIDLAARGLAEDVDVIGEIVQEIAAVDVDDGVTFEVGKSGRMALTAASECGYRRAWTGPVWFWRLISASAKRSHRGHCESAIQLCSTPRSSTSSATQ
jgi:hypothetical protein